MIAYIKSWFVQEIDMFDLIDNHNGKYDMDDQIIIHHRMYVPDPTTRKAKLITH